MNVSYWNLRCHIEILKNWTFFKRCDIWIVNPVFHKLLNFHDFALSNRGFVVSSSILGWVSLFEIWYGSIALRQKDPSHTAPFSLFQLYHLQQLPCITSNCVFFSMNLKGYSEILWTGVHFSPHILILLYILKELSYTNLRD